MMTKFQARGGSQRALVLLQSQKQAVHDGLRQEQQPLHLLSLVSRNIHVYGY